MSPEQWHRIRSALANALEKRPSERADYLRGLRDSDPDLVREVQSLLEYEKAGELLTAIPSFDSGAATVLPPGRRVGRYEVRELIGAGGMGHVYRAHDPELDRDVALKVLPDAVAASPRQLRRFEQEARTASALNHPHIVAVYDVGTHQGAPYLVTELLEGKTLRARLLDGAIPVQEAVAIGLQVARGLSAAHEKGIVHRDLKPENLYLLPDGHVKILDFGLAKLLLQRETPPVGESTPAGRLTESGVVMGTAGYMAPEQAVGGEADQRSDVFAFGCVLYEMLCGHSPFLRHTSAETVTAILQDTPPPLGSAVPVNLARVVERCLAKRAAERYSSAQDLTSALQATEWERPASAVAVTAPSDGRQSVRRFLKITAAGLVSAVLAWTFAARRGPPPVEPQGMRSIAVLPMANLSGDADQEFLADGMTEALIADLGTIRSLSVISRTSAMRYKGASKSVPEIAHELGVQVVVEGSVQKAGDQIRVTVQLIEAAADRQLWANTYQRQLKNVLGIQAELAQAIAAEIQVTLAPDERRRLDREHTLNPEAHEAYLRGRYEWHKRTKESLLKARDLFQRSIELDPTWAAAYAGLADAYLILGDSGFLAADLMYPRARGAALRAMEIDDHLPEAHQTLAHASMDHEWAWARAETEVRRALELNPSLARARQIYAYYLAAMGRIQEGLAEIKKARELDPLSPRLSQNVGLFYYLARDYQQALREFSRSEDVDPVATCADRGTVHVQLGAYQEAIREADKVAAIDPGGPHLPLRAYIYAAAGRRDKALTLLRKIESGAGAAHRPGDVALVWGALGERDRAFEWLEKGYSQRALVAAGLVSSPAFDPLRSDPRFAGLLKRMNLPPHAVAYATLPR